MTELNKLTQSFNQICENRDTAVNFSNKLDSDGRIQTVWDRGCLGIIYYLGNLFANLFWRTNEEVLCSWTTQVFQKVNIKSLKTGLDFPEGIPQFNHIEGNLEEIPKTGENFIDGYDQLKNLKESLIRLKSINGIFNKSLSKLEDENNLSSFLFELDYKIDLAIAVLHDEFFLKFPGDLTQELIVDHQSFMER